jgi:putative endonuclease
MATVYVIRSAQGHRYVGCTEDLGRRLAQHNEHKAGWTKRGTSWQVIHTEEFPSLSQARRRERWLKTGAGRLFLDSISSSGS